MDQGDYNPLLVTKQAKNNKPIWIFVIFALVVVVAAIILLAR